MQLRKPQPYGTTFRAKRWLALVLSFLMLSLPLHRAYAQEEEEEKDGSKAAEILLGVAAILAPIMAMVAAISAAKSQAEADKFVAKTAAEASITQTKMQSTTTLALAADQKSIAEKNLQQTEKLAERQERNSKERLLVQLTAIEKERNAQAAERKEIRDIEQKRADEQIAFARETALQNLQLAQVALNNQLVQQGLQTTGGATGSGRLTNTASGATAASPLTNSIAAAGSTTSLFGSSVGNRSATSAGQSTQAAGSSQTTVASAAGASTTTQALNNTSGAQGNQLSPRTGSVLGVRAVNASSALLASLNRTGDGRGVAEARGRLASTEALGTAYGTGAGGLMTASEEGDLTPLMRETMDANHNRLASTRGFHNLTADFDSSGEEGASDLLRFAQDVSRQGANRSGFTDYLSDERKARDAGLSVGANEERRPDDVRPPAEQTQGVYRPPSLGQDSQGRRHVKTN